MAICCQFAGLVRSASNRRKRWGGEVRPGVVTWSDLISWCYFVSGGGRLTSLTSHPVRTDLTWSVLRSDHVKTARCVWPQLSSVHQREITHLSPSHGFVQFFFFIWKAREMIDEYRGPGVSFLSVIRAPLSSQQEDWDWEVTSLVRSARTDRRDFINNYFPLEGWSLLWLWCWLLLLVGCWLVTDHVVDVVMLFNILPVPPH